MSQKKTTLSHLYQDEKLLPILPLRDVVIFPSMIVPLFVGRPKSIAAISNALEHKSSRVLLFTQINPEVAEPGFDDLISIGILGKIIQKIALPDGTIKVLVEGMERAQLTRYVEVEHDNQPAYGEHNICPSVLDDQPAISKAGHKLIEAFKRYAESQPKVPAEVSASLEDVDDLAQITDIISAQVNLSLVQRQDLLIERNVAKRIHLLLQELADYGDIKDLDKKIQRRVKGQMDRNQKEYYLNEQMKAIQKELHELDDEGDEFAQLEKDIRKAQMSDAAAAKAFDELEKLKRMAPMSAEATIVRHYLDWLIKMPWSRRNNVAKTLKSAEKVLNRDHHGLDEVKERLIEHLAVQLRIGKVAGSIICLVGPPGVGKTSLGKSIAESTNREFARIALGGMRDEAEIRGHRRTYIGAQPGKIVQTLAKVKTKNPVILLDEIDKMGQDFRGDPSSALLEVLDPAQNHNFADHFLETEFDLSEVLFIATANTLNIPAPLLDRLEVIKLSGYTELEKLAIAKQHLYPKQRKSHALSAKEISLKNDVFLQLIRRYTREAGVRDLNRNIAKLCRKVVRQLTESDQQKVTVTTKKLTDWLGAPPYKFSQADVAPEVGRITGLAWTQVGGELLSIEAVTYAGNGKLAVSGSLGDVMKESITAAFAAVRANAERLGITGEQLSTRDLHVHLPDGATPKDGPSAGIAIFSVIVSCYLGIPVVANIAMTGELTLSGRVMRIGGLKEKLLAAHRAGIQEVLIPEANLQDLDNLPAVIQDEMTIVSVKTIDEVLAKALVKNPLENSQKTSMEHLSQLKNNENFTINENQQKH